MIKQCTKCREEKSEDNYRQSKYRNGALYFRSICKKCESKIQVERARNKEKTVEQKEKFAQYKRQWREKNREKINKQYRDRIASDINFRLRKNVSRAVQHAVKRTFSKKNNSILKYLPYSIDDLKISLEKQFIGEMSWNNYGKFWHIDHVIPQSCLPYSSMDEDNFRICWSLENLRPLEAEQNLIDGATKIRHKMYQNKSQGVM